MKIILNIDKLGKTYQSAGRTLTVLDDINFAIAEGSTNAIVGPSGSGKTTLLGLCAGLDKPGTGKVELNNINLGALIRRPAGTGTQPVCGFYFPELPVAANFNRA